MNVIIDTGCANLSSLKFAIERLDSNVIISADSAVIEQADKVFLPGVGTAKHAMANLTQSGLDQTIKQLTQPVLGICLGMQLMTEQSKEGRDGNSVKCLGVIETQIKSLSAEQQKQLRVPHMGWNTFSELSEHPLFSGINPLDYFYYVHSYAAPVSRYTLAQCNYNAYANPNDTGDGVTFSAAIAKDNFIGVQFHPARSGVLGSRRLKTFLEMPP
jgi:glutamine amidotransferase